MSYMMPGLYSSSRLRLVTQFPEEIEVIEEGVESEPDREDRDPPPEYIFEDSFFQHVDDLSSMLRIVIIVCCDVCPLVTVIFDVIYICQHQGDWREIW